jgi:hypothetical protein
MQKRMKMMMRPEQRIRTSDGFKRLSVGREWLWTSLGGIGSPDEDLLVEQQLNQWGSLRLGLRLQWRE